MTTPDANAWRYDFENAPRGEHVTSMVKSKDGERKVTHFEPTPVILASRCGKVIKSRWMPEPGRWEFFNKGEPVIAWQPWPTHPNPPVSEPSL